MADKLLLVNLNLNGNLLKNVAVESLATAPENPVTGQFYINSADGKFYYYNGTAWVAGAEYSASNKSAQGAIGVYDSADGNEFIFKAVKGSGNLQVNEASGIITFSIDETNLSVSTAVAQAIATAKSEAIAAAASDATSKADAAQAAAEATAAAALEEAVGDLEDAIEAEETRATAAEAAAEQNAKDYTDAEIAKLDVSDSEVDGQFVVAVSEADGKVSVSRKAVAGAKVTLPGTAAYGNNSDVDSAIADLYTKSAAGAVTVEQQATAESGYAATYVVKQGGAQVGVKINIPKDYLVKSAELKTVTTADDPYQGAQVGDKYIDFVVNAIDASETAQHIYLPVNDLVDVYTAGDGLALDANNEFSIDLDPNSEAFLSIDATSKKLKLAGVQSAINTAKSDVIGASGDAASANTIYGAKAYADAAAGDVASDLIGESTDASSADTIYGAKKKAEEEAAAAESAAETYADGLKSTIDDYTVNGKKISTNPTITAKVAQTKITAASSGVTIATKFPGTIKAFYNGAEAAVAIAYDGTTATLTWNGNATLDIYYLAEDVTLS